VIYAAIIACEVGFWVVLLAGLVTRYGLRRPRIGAVLLACVPLVDLALLVFSIVDLRRGGHAGTGHGLAAVYLGVTVAYGHRVVRWADGWFAYRFAGAPRPAKPPRGGPAHARHERAQWLRHLLAWALGCALLGAGIGYVGDLARTQALLRIAGGWTFVLAIDFLIAFSYTLFPRRSRA
jgi:hypothetical protein